MIIIDIDTIEMELRTNVIYTGGYIFEKLSKKLGILFYRKIRSKDTMQFYIYKYLRTLMTNILIRSIKSPEISHVHSQYTDIYKYNINLNIPMLNYSLRSFKLFILFHHIHHYFANE